MRTRGLPGPVRWILRLTLPGDWRDDIIRDLEADLLRRSEAVGAIRARAWLWGQVVSFSVRFLPARLADLARHGRWTSLDLKLALRAIVGSPGLSVLAVLSLSLGIAATAGAFTLIEGAFFTTIPYPGGERIVLVEDFSPARSRPVRVEGDELRRRQSRLSTFEYLGAYDSRPVVLGSGEGAGRRVMARFVTPEVLALTEVAPRLGRLPDADDARPGAEPVVVLPHFLWESELGGDPDVLGTRVEVAGVRRTVIGVMPEDFAFPLGNELWIPFDPRTRADGVRWMVGKLRSGVDLATARAEVAAVARPDPPGPTAPDEEVEHLVRRLDRRLSADGQLIGLGTPLLGLVLLLLAMASNVAMLVLARNAARADELAVRTALGAGRGRIVGQLALEVGLLVAVAGAAGLFLAREGIALFESRVPHVPFWADFSLDLRVLGFALGLAALATIVAGVLPALRVTSGRLQESLKEGTRGATRVRFGRLAGALIVVELAVCVGFLSTAGVLGRSLLSFGFEDGGLPLEETLVAHLQLDSADDPTDRLRRELLQAGLELPGARTAAVGSRFPGGESNRSRIETEGGRPDAPTTTELVRVGPSYFELLGVEPLQGRTFTTAEHAGRASVVVVNRPFVQAHLGGGNAVGRRIRLPGAAGPDEGPSPWMEIVGVVPDLGLGLTDPTAAHGVYLPLGSADALQLAVRGNGVRGSWIPTLLEAVREVDPEIQVQSTRTLAEQIRAPVALFRGLGMGFLLLGGVALLLSGGSLHALTSSAVTRRTRELGIRQALGARRRALVLSVLRRAAGQVAAGGVLGALLALGLLRLGAIFPWPVPPGGGLTVAVVTAILTGAVALALAGPLRRALAIRPAEALRSD